MKPTQRVCTITISQQGNTMPAKFRPDRDGTHRKQFEKNKAWIYATQDICGICGKPVDKTLKYPHPLSKCIDHIIPVSKGGHPSDRDNLQLAHWTCNRQKSDKLLESKGIITDESMAISNRLLPHSIDWTLYKGQGAYHPWPYPALTPLVTVNI